MCLHLSVFVFNWQCWFSIRPSRGCAYRLRWGFWGAVCTRENARLGKENWTLHVPGYKYLLRHQSTTKPKQSLPLSRMGFLSPTLKHPGQQHDTLESLWSSVLLIFPTPHTSISSCVPIIVPFPFTSQREGRVGIHWCLWSRPVHLSPSAITLVTVQISSGVVAMYPTAGTLEEKGD